MYKKKTFPDTQHCCGAMKYAVEHPFCALEYAARYREYILKDYRSDSCIIVHHCFHCGATLPKSLRDLWFETLWEKYKIEDPSDDLRKVPRDFLTDVWWKKLGYKDLEDSKCETGADKVIY